MQLPLTAALLFAAAAVGTAVDQCRHKGYADYQPLAKYQPAHEWCGKHYPCVVTRTTKVTKLRTHTAKPVVKTDGTTTVTDTVSTSTKTSTTSTVTSTSYTSTATSTSFVCTTTVVKREPGPTLVPLEERSSNAQLLSHLQKQPAGFCGSVCRCNGCCRTRTVTETCHETTTVTPTVCTAAPTTTYVTGTTTVLTDTTTTVSTVTTSVKAVQSCSPDQSDKCPDGTTPAACNSGSYCSDGSCYCASNTEGESMCLNPANFQIDCNTSVCTSQADCKTGEACITDTCCGTAVCVPTGNSSSCPNGSSTRRLFRPRGRVQKKATLAGAAQIATVLPPRPTS